MFHDDIRRRRTLLGVTGGLLLAAALGLVLAAVLYALPSLPRWYDAVLHVLVQVALAMLVAVALDASGVTRTRQRPVGFTAIVCLATLGWSAVWNAAVWLWLRATARPLPGGLSEGSPELFLVDLGAALFGATVAASVLVPTAPHEPQRRTHLDDEGQRAAT